MVVIINADIVGNHFSEKNKIQNQPNNDKNVSKDDFNNWEAYELEEYDDLVADLFILK